MNCCYLFVAQNLLCEVAILTALSSDLQIAFSRATNHFYEIVVMFLDFYQMKHSLHVFVPEMSLPDFPKGKNEVEREIGMTDRDASKPLLLRLIEQVKFGAAAPSTQTFGSNPLRPGPTEAQSLPTTE